jgi:isocitrate/isopropylmalate dehydrogenase
MGTLACSNLPAVPLLILQGQGIANPIAQILSAAMMLKYAFGLDKAYEEIFSAIDAVLEEGYRTGDIASGDAKSGRNL